jgi:mitotic spindle assembly checkpoint protein MAD2
LVVIGLESNEVLERWIFNVETETENNENINENNGIEIKSKKQIHKEISAIMKQIFSSSSVLSLFEEQCTFDLLIYTDKDAEVPKLWEETDPKYIKNSSELRLRSFSTSVIINKFIIRFIKLTQWFHIKMLINKFYSL